MKIVTVSNTVRSMLQLLAADLPPRLPLPEGLGEPTEDRNGALRWRGTASHSFITFRDAAHENGRWLVPVSWTVRIADGTATAKPTVSRIASEDDAPVSWRTALGVVQRQVG